MKKFFTENQDFFGPLLTMALPLAFQNLIAASLNMIDTVMIGQLGQTEIAAVGLANQYYFVIHLFLFGINSGAAIFVAQFWGQKDTVNIRRILGVSLIAGILVSMIFTLVAFFKPEMVLGVFSKDPAVIIRGSEYLPVVAVSYLVTAVSFSYSSVLRSTGEVMLPVKVSILALITNTILNYLLIYGKFGFPRMEVAGAALATTIARALETFLLLAVVYGRKMIPAAKIKELIDLTIAFVGRFLKTTVPVVLNESLWAVGVTMFSIVYARMGTAVIAGVNIFSMIERFAFVLFFGLAQACAVTVGNDIGAGEEAKALTRAKQYSLFGPVFSLLIAVGLLFTTDPILSLFRVSQDTIEVTRRIIFIFIFFLPVKVFNLINVVGILRGGGDTRFSLFLDIGALWLIAVPVSFLAGLVWRLPPAMVYLLAGLEEVFKLGIGINRVYSGKWINNLTHSMRETVEKDLIVES